MKEKVLELVLQMLALVGVVLMPVKTLMLATGVLVFADMVLGIWAAVKAGRKITSTRLGRTISKSVAYQLAILAAFAMDKVLGNDDVLIAKAVAALIGLTEGKSISENLEAVTGLNFWEVVVSKIKPPANSDKVPQDRLPAKEEPPTGGEISLPTAEKQAAKKPDMGED